MLTVLCPSRNNPGALHAAWRSYLDTCDDIHAQFIGVVDVDDPQFEGYEHLGMPFWVTPPEHVGSMNSALNWAALQAAETADIIGFVGDDHRFRTKHWDTAINAVLTGEGGGFVYADDLAQRERLPTQVFISAPIIRSLGWMGLPGARHLFLDDTWKTLGEEADCLYYMPDIVIEHLHPAYGKAEWDENHQRVNSAEMYSHDRAVFEAWYTTQREADVQRVRQSTVRPVAR